MFRVILIILILVAHIHQLKSCCAGERYSITELLLSTSDKRSILEMTVDSTWQNYRGGYMNRANVTRIYKGTLKSSSIIVSSGGNTSAGGHRLIVGQSYLLVNSSRDGKVYGGFVCDAFSSPISPYSKYARDKFNPDAIGFIRDYYDKVSSKYTGAFRFSVGDVVFAEGTMRDGVPTGEWTHYTFERDGLDKGKARIKSVANYQNGVLHGKMQEFSRRSKITSEKIYQYENGMLISIARYEKKGQLSTLTSKVNYFYEKGIKSIHMLSWYTEDKTQLEKSYLVLTDKYRYKHPKSLHEILHGINRRYTEEGILIEEGSYFWGAKVDWWTYYDDDGNIESQVFYESPKISRDSTLIFYPDANIAARGILKDGLMDGEWSGYDLSGKQEFKANYDKGLIDGIWSMKYWNDTELREEYKDGLKNGEANRFNNNTLISREFYQNDLRNGLCEYFEKGKLKRIETYLAGDKHGPSISFNTEGDSVFIQNYKQGFQHGFTIESQRQNGIATGHYDRGQKVGVWKFDYPDSGCYMECEYEPAEKRNEYMTRYSQQIKIGSTHYYNKSGQKIAYEEFQKTLQASKL